MLALGLLPLIGLGIYPLHEPDEGRYAGIAAWMAQHGDWLTPHLNGLPYYEKPPFYFWLSAISIKILGTGEAAARLPSVIASLATLLLVASWGRRALGRRGGILSPLFLAAMPLFALMSRLVLVDSLLACFTTLALYGGYRGLIEPDGDAGARRRWISLLWIACALATLVKGPIGAVLPLAGLGATLLSLRRWRGIGALLRPDGLLLFGAVVIPYYLALDRVNPGYLREFLIEQNFQRLTTGGRFGRARPIWYYAPIFVAAFLPWSLLLFTRMKALWRESRSTTDREARLLRYLTWSLMAPLLVLSLAHSKLPYYILPLAPPLALLLAFGHTAGASVRPARGTARGRLAWWLVALAATGIATVGCGALWASSGDDESLVAMIGRDADQAIGCADSIRCTFFCGGLGLCVLAGLIGVAAVSLRRGRRDTATGWAAAGAIVFLAFLPRVAAAAGPLYSVKALAGLVRDHAAEGSPVITYERFLRGLPYYLGRPTLLWYASQAEFGRKPTAEEVAGRSVERDMSALEELLRSRTPPLVVATRERYRIELMRHAGDILQVVARLGPYTLLRVQGP